MNCRHGEGEMLFLSGARYKGQWRNSDMCHGLLDFDEIKKQPHGKIRLSNSQGSNSIRC
jgi:hypothetical protein